MHSSTQADRLPADASVKLDHVGVGCNRVVHALHWGEGSGLLAYGAHNAVAVYHPEEARVLGTLLGHTDVVTCVRWLPAGHGAAAALASGSGDCTVRLWLWTPHTPHQPWRLAATLQAHTAPVTSVTIHDTGNGGLLLVSTAGDAEAVVWERDAATASSDDAGQALGQEAWRLRQRIPLGHQLQHCSALAPLPGDPAWLLLALGGVDGGVRLYCCPPGGLFTAVCRLEGHQDWVRGLDFAQVEDGKLLLASASQDKNVRVWAVTRQQPDASGNGGCAASSGAADPASLAQRLTRYAPKPAIHAGRHTYAATLEALLVGHEDWVHSVAWHPPAAGLGGGDGGGATATRPACLLTASMDRTMMIWRPDAATGLWMGEESVGDAGANHLGYYGGGWGPGGAAIAAHGFTGALHIWRRQPDGGGWLPQHALGGHFGPVVDACWAADGACLLTVSADQTARITTRMHGGHWCEIARPQVHGHDFAAVAALPAGAGAGGQHPGAAAARQAGNAAAGPAAAACEEGRQRYLYASGSEEKVVRVFEAPRAFTDTLAMARGRPDGGGGARGAVLGALLPALGLSNKAVYQEDGEEGQQQQAGNRAAAGVGQSGGVAATGAAMYADGPDLAPHAAPSAVAGPPLEEHLCQNTLWPEVHKLYGHGNDLYCLAADPAGRYLASASRAQSADAAAIWLWDTRKWVGCAQLHTHTLTVTQLAFSPDGRWLASASRDRTVAVFERQPATAGGAGAPEAAAAAFRLVGRIKAHTRIVWALHWSPDGRLLATASRDGKVKVWRLGASSAAAASEAGSNGSAPAAALPSAPVATIECGDSVRSVQFAPVCRPGTSYYLAAGLESGALQLLQLVADASSTPDAQPQQQQEPTFYRHQLVWHSSQFERHAAAVRRLCWRRSEEEQRSGGPSHYHLASCSDDHALRVFAVSL